MPAMQDILTTLSQPAIWAVSSIAGLTTLSVTVMLAIIFCGFALAKMRYSPLWILLILTPYGLPILPLWYIAFTKWPIERAAEHDDDDSDDDSAD